MILVIIASLSFSCLNGKDKKPEQPKQSNDDAAKIIKDDSLEEYIIIKVSDRNDERIDKTENSSSTELRTTSLKKGTLTTTFKVNLETFNDEHDYNLELRFTRISDNSKLEMGTYHLVSLTDGVKLQPKTDLYFESINTFTKETYDNIILSKALDDFPTEFYAPFSEENIIVIESTKDLGETENSNATISEHFQRVKGHIEFNIVKIQTNKAYTVRVEFNIINEIHL